MSSSEAEPGRKSASSSQAQDVAIGRDFQVGGEGNTVDFSQTTIDQSHAQISHTQILQVAFDEVRNRPLNPRSPYLGLRKFEVRDRLLFFGRDRIMGQLQERLQEHFLLVLGASGSGKSSLIRAGLIAQLAEQRGGSFRELICTPDRNPFESFRASLINAGYRQSATEFLQSGQVDGLLTAAQTIKQPDENWLIFIDQFEELFTLCPDGLIRQNFIDALTQLVQAALPTVDLVVAMRADFLDRFSAYPSLSGILQRSELITDLGDDELRLAIEQPAAHHGVVFEPGLVGEIIQDLKGRNETGEAERISLPLLQYTLKLLWENSGDLSDRILRTRTYRQLGGVRGALQRRVDEIYNGLSAADQQVAKHIFLQLVDTTTADVGTTTVGKAVSRRATLSDFGNPAEQKVLEQLINASLLISDRPNPNSTAVVELAHETLIDSWDTLKSWIEESKPLIRLRNQLKDDASRWYELQEQNPILAESELWQGTKLQRLLAQKDELCDRFGNLGDRESTFIAASAACADQEHRREVQRLRRTIAGVGVALVAVSGLAFLALTQWIRAEQGQIQALTQTAKAEFTVTRDTLPTLITALESGHRLQRLPSFLRPPELQADVMTALAQGVYWVREKNRLEGHTDSVEAVAFSPDGETIATASYDKTVKLWNQHGQPQPTVLAHDGGVLSVAFSPDGTTLASADENGVIKLWSTTGEPLGAPIQAHSDYIHSVRFNPTTNLLASAGADGTVKGWDLQGNARGTLASHDQPVRSIDFSPDGETLATASADGTIQLWNSQGQRLKPPLQGHQGRVMTVRFSPASDPRWLVSGDDSGKVRLWKATGEPVNEFISEDTTTARQVVFHPDGQSIAVARDSGAVEVWSLQGQLLATLKGHSLQAKSVSFNPEGTWLASASQDKTVKLWQPSYYPRLTILPSETRAEVADVAFNSRQPQLVATDNEGQVTLWNLSDPQKPSSQPLANPGQTGTSVSISPDGNRIASSDVDGHIRLWTATGDVLKTIENAHLEGILGVTFSPDGKTLASGGRDALIKLWDEQGQEMSRISGHQGTVNSVRFYPDGSRIASSSDDGTAKLWDVQSGQLLQSLEEHQAPVWGISFSPNGKLIATSSSDKTVKLWGFDRNLSQSLTGHTDTVNRVQFSTDGLLLYSASNDKTINAWNLKGQLIMSLIGHEASVFSLSLKDTTLASTGKDGNIILWNQSEDFTTLDGLITQGCSWVKDYLSTLESDTKRLCD